MLDRYIKVNEKKIVAGQTAAGVWYCKELVAETPSHLKQLVADVNNILNEYNAESKNEKPKKN